MSSMLIHIYQMFVTAFLICLFIAFWSKTYIITELYDIESKLDRVLHEHQRFHKNFHTHTKKENFKVSKEKKWNSLNT